MLFKIGLPNPNEMKPLMYFAQARIALKAAEKAYEEATKNLSEEEKEDFFMIYRFPILEDREQDEEYFMKVHSDELGDQMQDIELEICKV